MTVVPGEEVMISGFTYSYSLIIIILLITLRDTFSSPAAELDPGKQKATRKSVMIAIKLFLITYPPFDRFIS